jgi:hypothetical protein
MPIAVQLEVMQRLRDKWNQISYDLQTWEELPFERVTNILVFVADMTGFCAWGMLHGAHCSEGPCLYCATLAHVTVLVLHDVMGSAQWPV